MFTRVAIVLGLTLVLILPLGASAQAPLLITGGGQVIADNEIDEMETGPGDTIAFVAREIAPVMEGGSRVNARGQLQVVQREGERTKFHGQVTCIVDEMDTDMTGDMARFGGVGQADTNNDGVTEATGFVVDVTDTGDEDRGMDQITFDWTADRMNPCDDDPENMLDGTTLARGNLKVDTAGSGR